MKLPRKVFMCSKLLNKNIFKGYVILSQALEIINLYVHGVPFSIKKKLLYII